MRSTMPLPKALRPAVMDVTAPNHPAVRCGARAEIRRQVWTLIEARHGRIPPSRAADTDLGPTIVIGDGCHDPDRAQRQGAGLHAIGVSSPRGDLELSRRDLMPAIWLVHAERERA